MKTGLNEWNCCYLKKMHYYLFAIRLPLSQTVRILRPAFVSKKDRSSHGRYFARKSVLRNFEKFTGKHLC